MLKIFYCLLLVTNFAYQNLFATLSEKIESYMEEAQKGNINPYTNLESFIQKAKQASNLLPEDLLKEISDFKENQKEDGYLLIKNLPTDHNLPKTPALNVQISSVKGSFISEFCLSLLASRLGELFNYIQEENGNIFRNIRPTKINAYEQTSDGSKVDLELHTETAFHPFKPDYLLLYCLRGDRTKQAFTLVSSLKKVVQQLDIETINELRKNQYRTGIDVSFGNKDKTKYWKEAMPVLYGTDENQMITYDLDLMVGLTETSQQALMQLKQAILKVQEAVLLGPGDILILDNRRAIHGRCAYEAFFDGYDRWLQRVYVSKDQLFKKNISEFGRVINYKF